MSPLEKWYFDGLASSVDIVAVGIFYFFLRRQAKKRTRMLANVIFLLCLLWSVKPFLIAANLHLQYMDKDLVAAQYAGVGLPPPAGTPEALPLPIPGFNPYPASAHLPLPAPDYPPVPAEGKKTVEPITNEPITNEQVPGEQAPDTAAPQPDDQPQQGDTHQSDPGQNDPGVINPDGDQPQMDDDGAGQDEQNGDQQDPDDPDEDDDMPKPSDTMSL